MISEHTVEAQRRPFIERGGLEIVPYLETFSSQVMDLARQMHSESVAHRSMRLNEAKLLRQLNACLTYPDRIYLRLAVKDGEVIGGLFGMIDNAYFSDDLCAKDLAWFITNDKRGSLAAVRLLRDFESWAMSHGALLIMLGQSTGVKMDETKALYERLGYKVVGVNTIKEF